MKGLRGFFASAAVALAGAGCGDAPSASPACDDVRRLALLAQSVPDAAYVPCIDVLAPGWEVDSFTADDDGAEIVLDSDRAEEDVAVTLAGGCATAGATRMAPRAAGARTLVVVDAISPSYDARIIDVFPGGCVTLDFSFERGPHIALVADLQRMVSLRSRTEVARQVSDELGARLDP